VPRDPSQIEDLIPHRGRMKLLDRIVELSPERATVLTSPKDDWPLAEAGRIPALVLLEVVAQTAGLVCSLKVGLDGEEPPLGYLVGVRTGTFFRDVVEIGVELTCRAEISFTMEGYAVLEGKVLLGEEVLFSGEVQLVGA
jgi:predicted hotdog family 3-hydroxylacyl-ACP dehydratase